MTVIKAKSEADLAKKAALLIGAEIIRKPDAVMGFATGSTPEDTYKELIELYKNGVVDFSAVNSFNLDEYFGIDKSHPQSYYYFMTEKLFSHVNINKKNIHIPDGSVKNPNAECDRYEAEIKAAGGIDLQLLGIGRNGHIGFNEPDSSFSSKTHLVDLTQDTLDANARFFGPGEAVPSQALSMGIKTIMNAKKILLIAIGAGKKDALDKMINQPVNPSCPASVLQYHSDVTVIYCD